MSIPVSLKNIAEAAGVSRTTVSLALRNHPRIPVATRERIQKLAEEMGYTPNAEVSKVMGMIREQREHHDRPVMALVTDYPVPIRERKPASKTWLGFVGRAEALGYTPEEFWIGDGKISPRRLEGILHARGIRGVVFAALVNSEAVQEMNLDGFSTSTIGHSIHKPVLHRSSSDKYTNTIHACDRLWQKGCRRIGLAVPEEQEFRVEHTFLSGYLVFHHLHRHKKWELPLVNEEAWQGENIANWAKREKLDGLVAAFSGLEDFLPGVRIAHVNVLNRNVGGIDQCHDRIAAGAVDLVDAQLRRNETGVPSHPKTMLVVGEWVEPAS